jgi:hypothetical protein
MRMISDEEAQEVTVKAPSKPVVSPEKKAEKAAGKALEEERYGVLQLPKKVDKFFGFAVVGFGLLMLFLLVFLSLTGQTVAMLFSSANTFFLGLWGVAGIVNIFLGLLLIGSE